MPDNERALAHIFLRQLLREVWLHRQAICNRPTKSRTWSKAMNDELIILKAAACMTLVFMMWMAWRSRQQKPKDWPPGEY